jgi:tRNA threonylcarbamoyladenosine biosynthesis protein TsaE
VLQLRSASPAATRSIAAAVARLARPGDVVVMAGEMGAGKTVFAQGFGAALGIAEPITSPTYTLVHSYRAEHFDLHHADIYRLTTHGEVADLALSELAEHDGVLLVEWGDVVAASLGDHLSVRLEHDADDEDARRLTVVGVGRSWATRWDRLVAALADHT